MNIRGSSGESREVSRLSFKLTVENHRLKKQLMKSHGIPVCAFMSDNGLEKTTQLAVALNNDRIW